MATPAIHWTNRPQSKDFDAARSYLSLVLTDEEAIAVVDRLRRARTIYMKPKDLERASGVKLLPPDDPEVASKPKKSRDRKPLTPVLLVRGSLREGHPLVIADGYHRICASYHVDRETSIPCRMVDSIDRG